MKVFNILRKVFSLLGFAFIIGAIFLGKKSFDFVDKSQKVKGTVIGFQVQESSRSRGYTPIIVFRTAKGQRIKFLGNIVSSSPSYKKGEQVEVLYLPSAPQKAKINSFWSIYLAPFVLGVFGVVFFPLGILFHVLVLIRQHKNKFLQEKGIRIQATFTEIMLNHLVKYNGEHPFVIVADWLDPKTGINHTFKSDNIWFDPEEFIPEEISVLIEQDNPKVYLMELDFLPKTN